MANYSNYSDYTLVSGSSGNDSIYNLADHVTIKGGAGKDTIQAGPTYYGSSNYVTINGGTGNDSINISKSYFNKIQYASGDGNDTIIGYGVGDSIQITSGTYTKSTVGNDVIIKVDSGQMILKNAKNKTINIIGEPAITASGNDTMSDWISGTAINVTNSNKNSIVTGTNYSDTITNYAGGARIYAGSGDDSIFSSVYYDNRINNAYGYVTIDGGDGNDTIYGNDPRVSINGGAGDDSIYNSYLYGNYVTIKGGIGNDNIIKLTSASYNIFQYANGDGNDTITGYNAYDSLQITSGSVSSTTTSGNDVLVNIGGGSIRLRNAKGKTVNLMDSNKRRITIGGNTFSTLGENITNGSYNCSVVGGNYNDTIYNGVSSINSTGNNSTVYAGTGNDYIYNFGERAVINGDSGNDFIYAYSKGSEVTINGGIGNDTIWSSSDNSVLNGDTGNDQIGVYGNYITVIGGKGNDMIAGSSSYNYKVYKYANGDGNDNIYGYNSTDTIQITSGTYSTQQSGQDVIITVGTGKITVEDAANKTLNIKGTPKGGSVNPLETDSTSSTINSSSGKYIYNPNNTILGSKMVTGSSGNDTIDNRKAYVTIDSGAGNDKISNYNGVVSISGGAGNDSIYNLSNNITIVGGKGDDSINLASTSGGIGTYGIMLQYTNGDGNDTVFGYHSNDIIQINDSSYITTTSGQDVIISVGNGSIRLKNAKDKALNLSNAQITLDTNTISSSKVINGTGNSDNIYITNSQSDYTVYANSGSDYITNSGKYNKIYGGLGADNITSSGDYATLYGEGQNDVIEFDGKNNVVDGGSGKDTITYYVRNAGQNNTTISGGYDGDNINIYYNNSNASLSAVIKDFTPLSLDNFNLTNNYASAISFKYEVKNNNIILTDDTGKIKLTFEGLTSINSLSRATVTINGNSTKITQITTPKSTSSSTQGKNIYIPYESRYEHTLVSGTSGNDTIKNWADYVTIKSGSGNDSINSSMGYYATINGGTGNDTINLSRYASVIQYANGDGNDTIQGYTSASRINITSGSYSTLRSGNDAIIKVGSGKMTIKDAAYTTLNITTSRYYTEELWFTADNNFITSDVDSILNTKAAITNDINYNFNDSLTLAKETNFIKLAYGQMQKNNS